MFCKLSSDSIITNAIQSLAALPETTNAERRRSTTCKAGVPELTAHHSLVCLIVGYSSGWACIITPLGLHTSHRKCYLTYCTLLTKSLWYLQPIISLPSRIGRVWRSSFVAAAVQRWESQAAHAGVWAVLQHVLTVCAPAPLLWDVPSEAPDDRSISG